MNPVEDRVREGLYRLAEPAEPRVDVESLIGGGERLRRRRRFGVVAAGVAGTAVVIVTAGALVPSGLTGVPVAGTPSPPVPVVSTTAGTAAADMVSWRMTDKDVSDISYGLKLVSVRLTSSGTGAHAVISATRDDGKAALDVDVEATPGAVAVGKLTDQVWVVLTDADSPWLMGTSATGGLSSYQPKAVGGYTAYLLLAGNPTATLSGFLWQGKDGVVRDQLARTVARADFRMGDRTYWYVRSPELAIACTGSSSIRLSLDGCATLGRGARTSLTTVTVDVGGSGGSASGNTTTTDAWAYDAGLLPKGADDVTADFALKRCQLGTSAMSGTGRTAFLVVCHDSLTGPGSTFTALHYRDADGRLATYRPPS